MGYYYLCTLKVLFEYTELMLKVLSAKKLVIVSLSILDLTNDPNDVLTYNSDMNIEKLRY